MNIIVLITNSSKDKHYNQWQFDKILAAIAYNISIEIVFINEGLSQVIDEKYWKSLSLYGIDKLHYIENDSKESYLSQLPKHCKRVTQTQLKELLKKADFIL